jgi:thiamine kinase-like enzyme
VHNKDYTVGDQVTSCTLEQAKQMAEQLGSWHGHWWDSAKLTEEPISSFNAIVTYAMVLDSYDVTMPAIVEYFAATLKPKTIERLEVLGKNLRRLYESLEKHKTLCHGDFRLDNAFLRKVCMACRPKFHNIRLIAALHVGYCTNGSSRCSVDRLSTGCANLDRNRFHVILYR